MQNQLWAIGEEAGCPFKHHSRASLCQLLQPSSEFVLHKVCSLVDAGEYSGACRLHLESLISESCGETGDVCSRLCSSSHTAVKSAVCETVGAEHTGSRQNEMEVEETLDSGYDSAQSYQTVQDNSSTSVSSSQSSESTDMDNGLCSNKTRMASNVQNTAVVCTSHVHQRCSNDAALPSKLVDCGNCDVQEHIVASKCDTIPRKLHAPVDFYTSLDCLLTSLQSHAAS